VANDLEIVYGSAGNDSIDGDLATGAEVAATVMGVPGFMLKFIGGTGNDTLIGGTGKDSGNDAYLLDNASELSDPDPTVHLCELAP
jgi:Ca2+-binding RTX toxin-like protein